MRVIRAEVPEAIVGAGTVCSARDVDACLAAGARFAVSPGYTSQLGLTCRERGLPLLPGVATAGEIMQAQDDGYTELKFFPALQAGGVAMLKALNGPFSHIQFCPTGGITAQNAGEFLALPNVICVGGSWLVPADALAQGDYKRIEALARQAVQLAS
jgi:2-dehydro-3-deoxyphosphogluconate aldolase/(4S)-4-hydroxy-2-oxoglutarate aldolase